MIIKVECMKLILSKKIILRVVISGLLLLLILQKISFVEILKIIEKANILLFLQALLLAILFFVLKSYRLYLLAKLMVKNSEINFGTVLGSSLIGYFYNLVLPSSIGGDFVKGIYLSNRTISKSSGIFLSFIDRVAGLYGFAVLGLLGITLVLIEKLSLPFSLLLVTLIFIFISLGISIAILLSESLVGIARKIKLLKFLSFFEEIDFSQKKIFFVLATVSVFFQIINVITYIVAAKSIGISLPFEYFYVLIPLLSLVLTLPITISGIGLREVSAVALFYGLGVPNEKIVAMTTIIFSQFIIIGLAGGILQIFKTDNNKL